MSNLSNSKVIAGTKWATLTEILAKLISPVTTMVLARLLTPEAFGIVVTATMVVTFAEIFTDAGFQKYLIQHEFTDDQDKYQSTSTAFWSNLALSMVIWIIIIAVADPLAAILGNPGRGNVIAAAGICIPLAAFSSIQMALYKRDLAFKTLFKVRLIGICIPLFVTVPLAALTRSYWSLIIGMICLNLSNAFFLTIFSSWKPNRYFSWSKLKSMLSFSIWSVFEAISIWLTGYVDMFIVGTVLSQHYLGIYRTSTTIVGQIMSILTASTLPVLYSSLSRLQNDKEEYNRLLLNFQKNIAYFVIPLGCGIFLFRDFMTYTLLGPQWSESAGFVGLWALTSSIVIVLSYYTSEVCRSKGKPMISFTSQVIHLAFLIPVIVIASRYGFETLYTSRSLIRFQAVLVDLIILYLLTRITPFVIMKNIIKPILAACVMVAAYSLMPNATSDNFLMNVILALCCALIYLLVLMLFPSERIVIRKYVDYIFKKQ